VPVDDWETPGRPFSTELLAEAKSKPGAWKIGDDGTPTGEYQANPRYGSSASAT